MKRIAFAFLLLVGGPANAQQYPATSVTPTNCSGTIASAGAAQTAIAANRVPHGLMIANLDTTEALWISFVGAAAMDTPGSFALPAGAATTFAGAGVFISPPGFGTANAVSVEGATAGHKFSCVWW